jgi:hypothetical protein
MNKFQILIGKYSTNNMSIKEAGQYRLIHHLSYPQNFSINDFIPEESKRVSYATVFKTFNQPMPLF